MPGIHNALDRFLPSKALTDRLLPWLTLILAIIGAGWTIFQYTRSVEIQRANTTLAIHRQFLDSFPNGAEDITGLTDRERIAIARTLRCEHYRQAIADGDIAAQPAPPDCNSLTEDDIPLLDTIGATVPQFVRERIRASVTNLDIRDESEARRMLTFFRSLQVCVERGQCGDGIASELFVADIVGFLQVTCALADEDPQFAGDGLTVATFARTRLMNSEIPWNTDPRRQDLMACNYLRVATTDARSG